MSTVPVTRTPLPRVQLGVLLYLLLAEPITSTVIYPFVNEAIRNLDITGGNDKRTGYYAGLIEACFFLTEAICVLQWGRLSDKIGRRPVLMIGLFGLTVSMLGFGLSRQYWAYVVSRCIEGALNGNVGVAKSVMAEITDATNMVQGFALLPAVWSVGSTIGPLIGGVLANPADRWPNTFKGEFWRSYPYFLPCFTSACFSLSAVLLVAVALKETFPSAVQKKGYRLWKNSPNSRDVEMFSRATEPRILSSITDDAEKDVSSEEIASLLPVATDYDQKQADFDDLDHQHYDERVTSEILTKDAEYNNNFQSEDLGTPYNTARIINKAAQIDSDTKIPTLRSLMIPRIIISLVNYAFLAFLDTAFVVIQPLMYSTSIESGGLGFSSATIGLSLAAWGFLNVFVQCIGFPWFHNRMGTRPLHTLGMTCFLGCFTAFPILSYLTQRAGGVDFLVGMVLVIQLGLYFFPCMAYSCLFIYITDAVPNKSSLGATNGFAQTTASTMRAIAPAAASSLYALSLEYNLLGGTLVFWILNVVAFGGIYASLCFPRHLKSQDQ